MAAEAPSLLERLGQAQRASVLARPAGARQGRYRLRGHQRASPKRRTRSLEKLSGQRLYPPARWQDRSQSSPTTHSGVTFRSADTRGGRLVRYAQRRGESAGLKGGQLVSAVDRFFAIPFRNLGRSLARS